VYQLSQAPQGNKAKGVTVVDDQSGSPVLQLVWCCSGVLQVYLTKAPSPAAAPSTQICTTFQRQHSIAHQGQRVRLYPSGCSITQRLCTLRPP
jgi:hypothetical protein